jgi:hypothetical protein
MPEILREKILNNQILRHSQSNSEIASCTMALNAVVRIARMKGRKASRFFLNCCWKTAVGMSRLTAHRERTEKNLLKSAL